MAILLGAATLVFGAGLVVLMRRGAPRVEVSLLVSLVALGAGLTFLQMRRVAHPLGSPDSSGLRVGFAFSIGRLEWQRVEWFRPISPGWNPGYTAASMLLLVKYAPVRGSGMPTRFFLVLPAASPTFEMTLGAYTTLLDDIPTKRIPVDISRRSSPAPPLPPALKPARCVLVLATLPRGHDPGTASQRSHGPVGRGR